MSFLVLKNRQEIVAARKEMRRLGIDCADGLLVTCLKKLRVLSGPRLGDRIKSWDVLNTVRFLSGVLDPTASILDLGAYASEVLPALDRCGFTALTGIDLNPDLKNMLQSAQTNYVVGDFYESGFASGSFSAVTAISVIEHGFDGERLLSEVSRLLRPGGYFIASVDYWSDKIDTSGIKVFGLDWMVFSRSDIQVLLNDAARFGLEPVGDTDFATDRAPIQWQGKSYTFAWFALKKSEKPL